MAVARGAGPAAARVALFGGKSSVPFALYRSGTSRGVYVLESDVPPKGPERDALLCKLMGSGHPQQLEGFGGGCGPTSKAVIVGSHADAGSVTYTFAQCKVETAEVDHSHGDCGNMIAAVAPFALERGLIAVAPAPARRTHVRIHSLSTGAVYAATVLATEGAGGAAAVGYEGDLAMPGIPSSGAPVVLTTFGVAGTQTGRLLPTGRPVDKFDLGEGLGEVSATLIDFARALILVDGVELLPKFGYASLVEATKERVEADAALNAALDRVRRAAALAMGMGDCAGKDAPKVAILTPCVSLEGPEPKGGSLACRYFVNPERCEMHPTVAMTAAQAIAASCLLDGSVAQRALGRAPAADVEDASGFSFAIAHPRGIFPVSVGVAANDGSSEATERAAVLFPLGVPDSGRYVTTVLPLADGRAFI